MKESLATLKKILDALAAWRAARPQDFGFSPNPWDFVFEGRSALSKLEKYFNGNTLSPSLHALQIGHEINLGPIAAVRVPGGWVFQNAAGGAAFVPWNDEGSGQDKKPEGRLPPLSAEGSRA